MQSKLCTKCNTVKPITEYHRQASCKKDGHRPQCRQCSNIANSEYRSVNKEKLAESLRRWKIDNPDKLRDQRLRCKYKITVKEWDKIFASQNNVCAICKSNNPKLTQYWHTDHCHTSNKVRGILCGYCNTGLGKFEDNTTFLQNAINYLQTHQ